MPQHGLNAAFMRGGTSKALVFRREDLPADVRRWPDIFLSALGSPDPFGRQLDGMGGGISSLSKVCVVGPSERPGADVDYTFAQVGVDQPLVDFAGTCGNMAAAIGPFAVDEGLVPAPSGEEAVVRVFNTNIEKLIVSRFPVDGGRAASEGEFALEGVAGTGAPIRLEFADPGGSKTGRLLPTGQPRDTLKLTGGEIEASCIDAASPCVFVAAASVGMRGDELPEAIERSAGILDRLEEIRALASVKMGIAADIPAAGEIPSVPKVAVVADPRATTTLSGRRLGPADMDIAVRMISMGRPHRAVPITGALCLAAAMRVPGTLPHGSSSARRGDLRIAHPSGTVVVDAAVDSDGADYRVRQAAVYRTARRLFEGRVFYRGE